MNARHNENSPNSGWYQVEMVSEETENRMRMNKGRGGGMNSMYTVHTHTHTCAYILTNKYWSALLSKKRRIRGKKILTVQFF